MPGWIHWLAFNIFLLLPISLPAGGAFALLLAAAEWLWRNSVDPRRVDQYAASVFGAIALIAAATLLAYPSEVLVELVLGMTLAAVSFALLRGMLTPKCECPPNGLGRAS